jgi:plastocyanin
VPTGGDKEGLMRQISRTRIGLLAVAMALPLTFVGCSSSTPTATSDSSTSTTAAAPVNQGQTVNITGSSGRFSFEPQTVTVKVGTLLTFKNDSATKHTVKADPGQPVDFSSETLAQNDTFVKTIDTPGTYTYFCLIHSKSVMSGTIIVTA